MCRICRVVVADDNPTMARAAVRLLESLGAEVVGAVGAGAGVLAAVDRHRPDLILVDLRTPRPDGLELARRLQGRPHPPAIVIMSMYDHPLYRDAAMSAGAFAFLNKSELADRLPGVLRSLRPSVDRAACELAADPRGVPS